MSGTTAIIFANQLYLPAIHPALAGADRVLLVESMTKLNERQWHIQKVIFILSVLRHYAELLRSEGYAVDYRQAASFQIALKGHIADYKPDRLVVVEPAEWVANEAIKGWARFGVPLTVQQDTVGFSCNRQQFSAWAASQKTLLLERFYRWQRAKLGVLMAENGKQPVENRWNFDAENRELAQRMPEAPARRWVTPDAITDTVISEARAHEPDYFGEAATFRYPVRHVEAEHWLNEFIDKRLAYFGPWEDAVRADDPFLFHSVIALLLNVGLLTPLDVVRRVEAAYRAGNIPIQSAEGFIRQIIGWREYVHGVYWRFMPDYQQHNFFEHKRQLPEFFWTGETDMHCLHSTINDIKQHAYTHHIPRLMLLANFANLAGINPAALTQWFKTTYIDAYDWVMWPNVLGLGLFADGGLMSTKPYIAGASYIGKMSSGYCPNCRYDPTLRTGPDACPFNILYWDFLARHTERLADNARMALILKGLARRDDLPQIRQDAERLRANGFVD